MKVKCSKCGLKKRNWRVVSGSPAKGTAVKVCDDCVVLDAR